MRKDENDRGKRKTWGKDEEERCENKVVRIKGIKRGEWKKMQIIEEREKYEELIKKKMRE